VQYDETPDGAKPFGEGLRHEIWKIVEDYDDDTYRAVYTAAFSAVVYVLDVFIKKSKSGIKTPQMDKDRVRDRFKAAKRDYEASYRKRGDKCWQQKRNVRKRLKRRSRSRLGTERLRGLGTA
jgi:phage-related protein